MKSFVAPLVMSTIWMTTLPSLAVIRSNFYLPSENFCAVYQGMINSEHEFVLLVKQENQLMVEANNNLTVAVSRKGKMIDPYQTNSSKFLKVSERFYRTKRQEKYTILVKGNTTKANIRMCLN
ncbi:hypothetical protein VB715_05875 [Crocosphaera sp. UHCC 0190]|uniref:hypothetical protein n=1 Tax=Crocosphaera sp. UHCC 0190 TaxID=3110246 RepID=UPI002B21DD83|nr:hypothetical protein [Crocosphaera sp. UHCC 0190]MEA5509289.1 hypothetical protein [Crocosphaera sp. UHCC 0190]